jgi:CBS domain-containing protein
MKGNLTARDVMTTDVQTVGADTLLADVAQLLAEHHISGVPVVDERRHVLGIVTEADLIDEHRREAHIPRVALYGLFPVPEETLSQAYRHGMELAARDLMTHKVVTASEETSVHELADLMLTRHLNRVPIVREGELVGIVTRADLVRALAKRPDP